MKKLFIIIVLLAAAGIGYMFASNSGHGLIKANASENTSSSNSTDNSQNNNSFNTNTQSTSSNTSNNSNSSNNSTINNGESNNSSNSSSNTNNGKLFSYQTPFVLNFANEQEGIEKYRPFIENTFKNRYSNDYSVTVTIHRVYPYTVNGSTSFIVIYAANYITPNHENITTRLSALDINGNNSSIINDPSRFRALDVKCTVANPNSSYELRISPNENSSFTTLISSNDSMVCLGFTLDFKWCLVECNGIVGWVKASDIKYPLDTYPTLLIGANQYNKPKGYSLTLDGMKGEGSNSWLLETEMNIAFDNTGDKVIATDTGGDVGMSHNGVDYNLTYITPSGKKVIKNGLSITGHFYVNPDGSCGPGGCNGYSPEP